MRQPNIVKDILLNRIYGKDYLSSRNQSSLQVFVSLITEALYIALEVFKRLEAILSCLSILLRDFPKVRIPGKFSDSVSQIHNLTQVASKMVKMKSFFSVDLTITPLKQFISTAIPTQKLRVRSSTFKIQIAFKNLISLLVTVFILISQKNTARTKREHS